MEQSRKCAHEPCECRARKASAYCSTECESAAEDESSHCACGHKACEEALESANTT